jgi:hypothetical protein
MSRAPLWPVLRSPRAWILLIAVAVLAVALMALPLPGAERHHDSAILSTDAPDPAAQPAGTTSFRIASFNLLGAGHTDGVDPDRKGWANSAQRLVWTRQLLDQQQIDVVGFQEMHRSQADAWVKNNPDWATFPALAYGVTPAQNSVSWRTSEFRALKTRLIEIPYFNGTEQKMPYVYLEHLRTGQRMWLYNVHNPANIGGDHQKWRDIGFARAIDLVKRLRTNYPGVPVFMTGDMNDREKFFCPTVGGSELVSASGGYATAQTCVPPKGMLVDWLLGTAPNTFTGYRALRTPLVQKTSDHPMVLATANIPSPMMQQNRIRRVVVVTVEGLRWYTLDRQSRNGRAPVVADLRSVGSSTFNARTAVESTQPLPNLFSILTGRPVAVTRGGHGVTRNSLSGTVHQAAGRYVSSVLDLVHNTGGRTRLITSVPSADAVRESWSSTNGGTDPYGLDDGRNKLSAYHRLGSDREAVTRFWQTRANPGMYTHIHLGEPRTVGKKFGFGSRQYAAAVEAFDQNLGMVRRAIRSSDRLRHQTLLVVAATGGGTGTTDGERTASGNYRVPLLVQGPGVVAGQNLYRLNPGWAWPGRERVGYDAQPITTGVVANLVLATLRLPPLPGSTLNGTQNFNVLTLP